MVLLTWTREFVQSRLDWTYMTTSGTTRKLPNNWEEQKLHMVQRAAFFMKAYSIPTKMFVNTDQTDIHLIPTSGARTWAKRWSKHVLVHGMKIKDKL